MEQSIIGNGNVQVAGNYNTIQQAPPTIVAVYQAVPVRQLRSAWAIAKPAVPLGAFGLFIGAVGYFGSWASILSWLRVNPNTANGIEFVLWLLGLATLPMVLWLVRLAYAVDRHARYHWFGDLYEKQEDGSVAVCRISAKCPVPGCPGTLRLKKPQPNEEGVPLAGICSHHGERHMFEFNDQTYQGSRVERFTPIKPHK
jgi:hypothetical protein